LNNKNTKVGEDLADLARRQAERLNWSLELTRGPPSQPDFNFSYLARRDRSHIRRNLARGGTAGGEPRSRSVQSHPTRGGSEKAYSKGSLDQAHGNADLIYVPHGANVVPKSPGRQKCHGGTVDASGASRYGATLSLANTCHISVRMYVRAPSPSPLF